jgi:Plasmid replication region DNA-binding N-term
MEREVVQEAVTQLLQQGQTLASITAPMVRAITGYGSYTTITQHLRTIRASAGVLGDAEEIDLDGPELSSCDEQVREAEEALTQAQQALQVKMDALPVVEAEIADARSRAIEALGAKLAVLEGYRLGVFTGDEQARAHVEGEVQDATQAYQAARVALQHAMEGIAGWGQRVRACERQLREAKREVFLQRERPELWQALQDAIAARGRDPWLQPHADLAGVQSRQAHFTHVYAIEAAQKACEQACIEAGL